MDKLGISLSCIDWGGGLSAHRFKVARRALFEGKAACLIRDSVSRECLHKEDLSEVQKARVISKLGECILSYITKTY